MGCGASMDAPPRAAPVLPPRDENMLTSIRDNRCLDDLADCVADLHHGMPAAIKQAPMRLVKVSSILTWQGLKVFEEVPASACTTMPYSDVADEVWDQTAVLSWRWGASKPSKQQHGFTPMLVPQFRELCEVLTRARDHGIQYVWIDWCCVPQYSANSMVEVMRSKVFYARARLMIIIPTFHAIPTEGIVRLLLSKAARALKRRGHKNPQSAVASEVMNGILARELVAGREYFSRVWTLAERMARHGRGEQLCNWLSLEAWLGMVVDAMLKSTEDKTASQIYKKILGKDAGDLLDSILAPLAEAVKTGSMLVSEGLDDTVANLFEHAVRMWQAASILEEAPTKSWLLSYMEDAHTGIYQAWNEGDRVWAIYSYFCWKTLDQMSSSGLLEALQDLVKVAGASRKHMLSLAKKLGIDKLVPEDPMDRKLFNAADEGDLESVIKNLAQGANAAYVLEVHENATPLHVAAAKGHLEVVKALVAAGAPLDAQKKTGATPLHVAAQNGKLDVVKALVELGADKEATFKDGATPLYITAEKGQPEVLKYLIEAGASMKVKISSAHGYTPYLIACLNGHLECAKVLIEGGCDKNDLLDDGASALYLAAEKNHVAVVKYLLEQKVNREASLKSGATALYIASQNNFLDTVKALIEGGANVNAQRTDKASPIYIASERGNVEVVRALLAGGADKDILFQSGANAIYVACQNNRVEVVKELLKAGADKSIKLKGGYQPIHSASLAGHSECIRVLVEGGVSVDAQLDDGATPLYLAAEKGHADACKVLLELGANKNTADKNGKKPMDVAKGPEVTEILRRA